MTVCPAIHDCSAYVLPSYREAFISGEIAEEKYDVHKVNAVMLREMGITQ